MSKQGDAGSRPMPVLHRPFEDGSDTQQRQIQRPSTSLLRRQFAGFVDMSGSHQSLCVDRLCDSRPGGSLQDPLPPEPTSRMRQLADERVYVPLKSMTSGEDLEADEDDDDTADSATFNVSNNNTPGNGQPSICLIYNFIHRNVVHKQ